MKFFPIKQKNIFQFVPKGARILSYKNKGISRAKPDSNATS
jgi:hypothetical protein